MAVPPERKVILWAGKLDDHKNWQGFLLAGRRLLDVRDDCELWMVGGETASDAVVLEMLDHARELRLMGRLRWLQRVAYDAMPMLYSVVAASGGITLSTSRDESFGMTVAESLACGCPAVAAAVGALPEILDGPLAVGLYPFFEVEGVVAAALPLLGGGTRRQSVVEAARQSILQHYDSRVAGPRYLEVVRRVIATVAASRGDRRDQP